MTPDKASNWEGVAETAQLPVEHYIRIEQTKALYQNLFTVPIGGIVAASVIVFVLWGKSSSFVLIGWWLTVSVVSLSHWAVGRYLSIDQLDAIRCEKWLTIHRARSVTSGILWGSVWILFIDPNVTTITLFLAIVFTGYIAGSMSSCAAYSPSFLLILVPASLPFIGKCFYEGGDVFNAIGIAVLLFCSIMIMISRAAEQQYKDSREVNYQNLQLMKQLAEQKDVAEDAARSKSQFLAAASHDLRQPFSAINLFLDSLVDSSTKRVRPGVLAKVRSSLDVLNNMLHSILDVSRLDSSSIEHNPVHLDVNDVLVQLVGEYRPEAQDKGLELNYQPCANLIAIADKLFLYRILNNLLDNAVKYTREGHINILFDVNDADITIHIVDTGIGIRDADQNKIFDEFYQLNNPERDRRRGMGLGLAIVQRMAALMQASLSLESQSGIGTSVLLTLPKGQIENVVEAEQSKPRSLRSLKVLVIDDDPGIRQGLELVLDDWGCQYIVAADYSSALDALFEQSVVPELLIVDFRLSGELDGIAVIELIQTEFNKPIPSILITGDTSPEQIDAAYNSDSVVLYKPISASTLAEKISNLLNC